MTPRQISDAIFRHPDVTEVQVHMPGERIVVHVRANSWAVHDVEAHVRQIAAGCELIWL